MSNRTKLLAYPKTDVLDRCCPIKRPDCLLPDIHLAGWNQIALFSKIPAKYDPEDPVVFTRPKLGKSLYRIFTKKEFDTHGTKDLPLDYNELHDPHLERYYRINRRKYKHLVKNNYITPYKDGVACTQADFNHYRTYLRDIIAQEEKMRRKREEKNLRAQIERYHAECFKRKQNRAWQWVKRALKQNKIQRRGRLNYLVPPTLEFANGEEDKVKVTKQEELKQIAKQVEEKRTNIINQHTEKVHERALARERRKIDVVIEKQKKKTALWHRMEEHQLVQIKEIEKIKDKYRVNMKTRVQECIDKFDRIKRRDERRIEAEKVRRRESQGKKYERKKGRSSFADKPIYEVNISDTNAPLDVYDNIMDDGEPLNTEKNMADNGEPLETEKNMADNGAPLENGTKQE